MTTSVIKIGGRYFKLAANFRAHIEVENLGVSLGPATGMLARMEGKSTQELGEALLAVMPIGALIKVITGCAIAAGEDVRLDTMIDAFDAGVSLPECYAHVAQLIIRTLSKPQDPAVPEIPAG
jgi:hypothetical protein